MSQYAARREARFPILISFEMGWTVTVQLLVAARIEVSLSCRPALQVGVYRCAQAHVQLLYSVNDNIRRFESLRSIQRLSYVVLVILPARVCNCCVCNSCCRFL